MDEHKDLPDIKVTPETGQNMADVQNLSSQLQASFSEDQRHKTALVNRRMGRKQALDMIEKIANVSNLVDLQKMKETKEYKGLEFFDGEKLLTISTWDDYCIHVEGRSRQAIDLDLQNLDVFGEELFDSMRQVGIGPGTMRALRKLPDDDFVQIEEAVKTKDEVQIKATIQDLQEKHAREKQQLIQEKEQLTQERDDVRADKDALEEVVSDKSSKIDELEKQVTRKRLERLSPDEEGAQLRKEADDLLFETETSIRRLVEPLEQVTNHAAEHQIDIGHWLRGQLDQISEAVEYLREQLGMVAWTSSDPDLDGEQWSGQEVNTEETLQ